MKTWKYLAVALLFSMAPKGLLAQHHGGHRSSGSASGPTADTRSGDIRGFERAVALQATPDQVTQFQSLQYSMETAQKSSQELLRISKSGNQLDIIHAAHPLSNAVDTVQSDNHKFLDSFTKEQQDGLKKFTKRLRKLDSEITSHSKSLNQDLSRAGDNQIAAIAEKLNKALSDLKSEQVAVAAEMGIPTQASSQQPQSEPVDALKR